MNALIKLALFLSLSILGEPNRVSQFHVLYSAEAVPTTHSFTPETENNNINNHRMLVAKHVVTQFSTLILLFCQKT